ncbi:hypothetical protein [Winogradskyella psychrotolerans]|uniref:hypothetical protein n=1 Tax=Winogradskyella psychrotolerans TaxID=1344585 RepID=UPI001C070850|nr:hypothetical protein [Winogradskyella psychrotolerans]MBU2929276.1 hypothetical protein [Winogradskyella psychrotolerans]
MSNLLRKPKSKHSIDSEGRYQFLNLKENPFPNTPYVNKNNDDIRYNGSIYESRIREKEHEQIIKNFIKVPQSDPNHIRLGYILDYSYVGRGNGKSAFALNLLEEINEEYCLDISNEQNKCFGLHITPEVSGRTKTFYSFTDLIFDTILDKNLINYSLASLRLGVINELYPNADTDNFETEDDLVDKLNDLKWYRENNIEIASITKEIYKENEILKKTNNTFPLNKDKSTYFSTQITNQKDFKKCYYETLKKGKDRIEFLFNDLVLLFEAAGFNGAYLIVDDFERIPDFQSKKLKQEFALELRTNFFDGILENAKIGFYNLILVLHAGVPRLVEEAWAVSGMDRRSPMNDDNALNVIRFDKLTIDHAVLMLEKYLEKYRIDSKKDSLNPFTKEAVKIISEKAELNASTILANAHRLIEKAADQKIESIDEAFVNSQLGKVEEESVNGKNEDISSESTEDLFKKSKTK